MRIVLTVSIALLCACSSLYYAGLERVGIPKRDLLERRVERARDAQTETKEQFRSALDRFRATVRVEGGELEQHYDALRAELDRSEARAKELDQRIDEVEDVAEALFDEWEDELDQYKRAELREASKRRLSRTRASYEPMIKAMRRAQARSEPALDGFRDVVLALKHQLNAKAVASIRGELAAVEREVDALVRAMDQSIQQASSFLDGLEEPVEQSSDARSVAKPRASAT